MPPKKKGQEEPVNPLLHPLVDLDHIPLVGRDYKIHEILCELELFEMYYLLEDKFIDKYDDIGLWEYNFPDYIFPHNHNAPEFIRKCQECYVPNQVAIISPTREILITIAAQSINQMMQVHITDNSTHFSQDALTKLYQNIDFAKRAKGLEIFLAEDAQLPKNNPPYPSFIFLERTKNIITVISYLLGYYSD